MEGSWPAPEVLGFLPILSLQALLLHPIFPVSLSLPLRILFTFPCIYLAYNAPSTYSFLPREISPLYNFILSVMCLYACWKSVEWGFAGEEGVLAYTWIGFEEEEEGGVNDGKGKGKSVKVNGIAGRENKVVKDNGLRKEKIKKQDNVGSTSTSTITKKSPKKSSIPSRAVLDPSNLRRIRQLNALNDSPIDILFWTLHLLMSMRGIGWAYGPSPNNVAKPYPSKPIPFFLSAFKTLFLTHSTLLLCAINLTTSNENKINFWKNYLLGNHFSIEQIHYFSETLTGLSLGTAAYAGLNAGYLTAILLVFIPTTFLNIILPSYIPKFEPKQYPPVFQSPWKFNSVRNFWSKQWHGFFSRPFQELGYKPLIFLLGDGILGKAFAVLGVFGMSAWLHEYALSVATTPLHYKPQPTFILKWGGSIYFLTQGFAIILETLYTTLTHKKISGGPLVGYIWSFSFIAGLGSLVYLSWFNQGILVGIPEFMEWNWIRWILPVACFAPGWMWIR